MSNTIRRPRKRPRKRSSNFRSLWWLVRQEAAFQILWGDVSLSIREQLRVSFGSLDGRYVARQVARHLRTFPARRITR